MRQGQAGWVEPLKMVQRGLLNTRRHAFYDGGAGGEAEFFLARDRAGRLVGRIGALVNRRYDAHVRHEQAGFFGWFDCIDSQPAASALIGAAGRWLRERGREYMLGPASPSEAYEYGLLVEGFDRPHRFMLTHQPAYYSRLLEGAGLVGGKDLLALQADMGSPRMQARMARFLEVVGRADKYLDREIIIRSPDIGRFDAEIRSLQGLFTEVLGRLWGHCPLGLREMSELCWSLRHFYIPDMLLVAEKAGRPIGMMLTVPDLNEAISRLWLRTTLTEPVELYLRTRRWKPGCARILASGVTQEFSRSLAVPAMVGRLARSLLSHGIRYIDAHLVLEDNAAILTPLRRYGFEIDRRYRIYRAQLHEASKP